MTATRPWRVTVLISGTGTNLSALLTSLPSSPLPTTVSHVLSSRATAPGLLLASSHVPPIPSSHFSLATYKKATGKDRAAYDLELARRVRATRPDLVVLAGWMLVLGPGFLDALRRDWDEKDLEGEGSSMEVDGITSLCTPGRSPYHAGELAKGVRIPIINLHPALPGTFPGAHAIKDAWEAFNQPAPTASHEAGAPTAHTHAEAESPLDLSPLSLSPSNSIVTTTVASPSTTVHKPSLTASPPSPTSSHHPLAPLPHPARLPCPTAPPRITKTGLMIHRVIPLLDAGAPILVRELDLREGESLDALEGRMHELEWEAIVLAVRVAVGMLGDGSWWEGEEDGA